MVENRQQGPNETASVGGAGARASRIHVRAGVEGLQDADRGQQPTIWAVASGKNPSGERARRTNCHLVPPTHPSATPHVLVAVLRVVAATGLLRARIFTRTKTSGT